jgi:hypothetical protein
MKQIEQTSLVLLIGTILLAVVMLSIHGIDKYMDEPSLFIPPADSKSRTTLNMVLDSKNLEGLKKVCSLWASQKDRESNALDALVRKSEDIKSENLKFILTISLMFSLGSGHIYFSVRKIRKESENAL